MNISTNPVRYLVGCSIFVLTAQMASGDLTTDLVLNLKLDGDTLDASAQGNDGTLNGSPSSVIGQIGTCLEFTDPASPHQYVSLGTAADFNFGASQDFSVSVWVKNSTGFPDNTSIGGSEDDPSIISNKDWDSGGNEGWVISAGGNGRWQWNIGDGSNRADYDGPADQINDGQWHHLAVTHDRDGNAELYYDGQPVSSVSLSSIGNIDSGLPTAVASDGTLGTVWASWFTGAIDDVGIWRRILTPGEVEQIHDNGRLGIGILGPPEPAFTTHPFGGIVVEGSSHRFSAQFSFAVGDVAYQWFKNGEAVPDATEDTLIIDTVAMDDAGEYKLRATDESKAVFFSNPATLIVWAADEAPVAGSLGLGFLVGAMALGGAFIIRRNK